MKSLISVLIQNRDLNNYILEKIENAINKVDYYDYFENIVEAGNQPPKQY